MDMKLRNVRPTHVLWVDLEMTGVSPTEDYILEVAAIVTDWDFNEVASYEGVIKNKKFKSLIYFIIQKYLYQEVNDY